MFLAPTIWLMCKFVRTSQLMCEPPVSELTNLVPLFSIQNKHLNVLLSQLRTGQLGWNLTWTTWLWNDKIEGVLVQMADQTQRDKHVLLELVVLFYSLGLREKFQNSKHIWHCYTNDFVRLKSTFKNKADLSLRIKFQANVWNLHPIITSHW